MDDGFGDTVAIHWEGEPGDTRTITYADLQREVSKTANALISLGLKTGDRVAIYLPMIPEAVFAMLACARLGLAHGVVFAGFSAEALRSRIGDAQARVVITADGQYRRGTAVSLKAAVDEAVAAADSPVEHVLVVRRTGIDVHLDRTRTCGGTNWSTPSPTSTRRRRSPPSNRCSSSTPPAPPANPRASCTPAAGTSPRPRTPTTRCSTTNPAPTCTGAPPTSAGSPGTPTSSTGRWRTGPPR